MLLNGDHGDTTPPSHGMLVFEQTATENVWNDVFTHGGRMPMTPLLPWQLMAEIACAHLGPFCDFLKGIENPKLPYLYSRL